MSPYGRRAQVRGWARLTARREHRHSSACADRASVRNPNNLPRGAHRMAPPCLGAQGDPAGHIDSEVGMRTKAAIIREPGKPWELTTLELDEPGRGEVRI